MHAGYFFKLLLLCRWGGGGGARGGTLWIPWDRGTPLHIQNIPHEVQKDISISLWGSGPSFVCERCGALAQMTVPILQIPLTVGVHTKHTNTHTPCAEHLPLSPASVIQASPAVESELWQLCRWLRVTNKIKKYTMGRRNLSLYWINVLVTFFAGVHVCVCMCVRTSWYGFISALNCFTRFFFF